MKQAQDDVGSGCRPSVPDGGGLETSAKEEMTIVCPLCGSIAVQEKCKVICRSEICRGRVVMNCSEF